MRSSNSNAFEASILQITGLGYLGCLIQVTFNSNHCRTMKSPLTNSLFSLLFAAAILTVCGCQTGAPGMETVSNMAKSPDTYKVKLNTTKGDIVLEITREWSPNGADRFHELVSMGYYKDIVIFRGIRGFMFQFGIHGDPAISKQWISKTYPDDPQRSVSNMKGYITFAKAEAANSRSVQTFINLGDNSGLDNDGFTPFGKVIQGMDVVEKINTEYGENRPMDQGAFQGGGNKYILGKYPNLDIIKSAEFVD